VRFGRGRRPYYGLGTSILPTAHGHLESIRHSLRAQSRVDRGPANAARVVLEQGTPWSYTPDSGPPWRLL